jgi:N-acetylneuraminate synthase
MTYMEYRERVEFGVEDYAAIDELATSLGIQWFASCWDSESVRFIEQFDPPCYKVASASITDLGLLEATVATGKPVILSTGMSTLDEIDAAVAVMAPGRTLITHSTSTYPCPPDELNLRMIGTLAERYGVPVGYSGHEVGLQTSVAAVAVGACIVERHITLDRSMWGTDQSASVEPPGLERLVRDIRTVEVALGDGVKKVYDSEIPIRAKLRG